MKYQQILNLAQRYDKAIEHLENKAIARLNKTFDDAYRQLLGQIKLGIYTQKQQYNLLNRNAFVAEQLHEILNLFITDNNREDTFNVLLQTAAQQGVFFSTQVADVAFANIPVEAIAFQTEETYKRLIRHGESFANDVEVLLHQGDSAYGDLSATMLSESFNLTTSDRISMRVYLTRGTLARVREGSIFVCWRIP